jgi:hypothetical protein
MSSYLGSCARIEIVLTQKVEQIRALQVHRLIRFAFFVNQKRKSDPSFFAKTSSVGAVAESYRRKFGAPLSKCPLVGAQLRDVLAAEDSTVMAQEHNNRRLPQPERAEANFAPVAIVQVDHRKAAVQRRVHLSSLT